MKSNKLNKSIKPKKKILFTINAPNLYNVSLENSLEDILSTYLSLCKLNNCNNIYALSTLTHIFLQIFYFTKNIQLTYDCTNKAMCEYYDYLSQFQCPRDAALHAYKKSIYEIPIDWKRNMPELSPLDKMTFTKLNGSVFAIQQMTNQMPLQDIQLQSIHL
jgi:hypothetical protein